MTMTDARLVAKVQVTFDVYIETEPEHMTTDAWEPACDYITVRDYVINDVWIDPETANETAELYEADGADDIDPDLILAECLAEALGSNLPEGEQTKKFREYLENHPSYQLTIP